MPLQFSEMPQVLAQTDQWIVVYKPARWLTIPGRPSKNGDKIPTGGGVLLDWVRIQEPNAWVVHRLDRDTSGVVLFARNPESHRLANEWFQKHQVKKAYDCLAFSRPESPPKSPMMRLKNPIEGASSLTQVEVKESYLEGLLARAVPFTGRRHQIRIHLSREGHPLWGDSEYGGPVEVMIGKTPLAIGRVALHSARLELPTREIFEAPWPEDFKSWVEQLRAGGTRV